MPAITVVMSAYNTEKYVGKAVESILNQTFGDFEFLIVDNGSTDGTGKIVDRHAEIDKRIQAFHNERNVEPSQALNFCLDKATGKYLYVIDSDDWAMPELLEKMVVRAERKNAQLIYTGFFMDHMVNGKEYNFKVCPLDADYTQREFREKAVDDLVRMFFNVYWNKLFKMDYLRAHSIRFRDTRMFDQHFNMDVLMDVERVSSIGEPLYHYIRARQGSYMTNNPCLNQKKREHFAHTMAVYRHWNITDRETMGKLAEHYLGDLMRCITETVTSPNTKEHKCEELKTIFEDELTRFATEDCPKGLKARLFCVLIRSRSIVLCKVAGWGVYALQRWSPGVYYRLRTSVAQKGAAIEEHS